MTRHPPEAAPRPHQFTPQELARLTTYGAAVQASFHDGWRGGEAVPTPRSL
jgi:hypothetical protein